MSDKKGNVLPPPSAAQGIAAGPPQANTGAPAPQPYGVLPGIPTAAPYMVPGQQLYAQGPPPTYDQALTHPAIVGQPASSHIPYTQVNSTQDVDPTKTYMSYRYSQEYHPYYQWRARENVYPPGAAMYAAAGYPTYLGYPTYAPMQYYPSLGAYSYPMQHAQLRPTIMIPNSYDGGARFDGIAQQVIPPTPPGVPPNAAQLAAMAGHQVALGQKKGSFLSGGSDGGYTFW